MNRYEFTYSFMKPEVHVYKVIVDAYNDLDAYYNALYDIATHLLHYRTHGFEAPGEAKLTCIKKGEVHYDQPKETLPRN